MLYFRCENLALTIRDCESLVGHGSSVVGAPLRNLAKFVYARGSKISHAGGLMCNLSWTQHSSLEKDNSLNHSGLC